MLDMTLIRGFYDLDLLNSHLCFHSFESLKNSKEDSRG